VKRKRTEQPAGLWNEVPATASRQEIADELLLLGIEELEARLTPDGWSPGNPHNSNPPGGQVGWGC
jgi:hypothetical protein